MVVHAGAGVHSGTLVNALLHRFEQLSGVGGALRPGIVHRLDRYTSGVLLVAKHDAAHRALAEQFAGRQVREGLPGAGARGVQAASGRIEKPIARDPVRRIRMTARLAAGRAAWSEYRVLRRFAGVHPARGADRDRPHAPDPRAPGQHRASGGGRPPVRRAGRRVGPARAGPLLPARPPHPLRAAVLRRARDGGIAPGRRTWKSGWPKGTIIAVYESLDRAGRTLGYVAASLLSSPAMGSPAAASRLHPRLEQPDDADPHHPGRDPRQHAVHRHGQKGPLRHRPGDARISR